MPQVFHLLMIHILHWICHFALRGKKECFNIKFHTLHIIPLHVSIKLTLYVSIKCSESIPSLLFVYKFIELCDD